MSNFRIYALRHESEEILAATCAKTSRSKLRFDDIARTIDEDRAAGLLDQVFNAYNHASVADIAVPVVALEDVSILASKILESPRRGFYQEKSTRYVEFTRASVYEPGPEFSSDEVHTYREAVAASFDAYESLTPKMMAWAETVIPTDTKNRAGAVRGKAFDSLRYLLPCGTTTQLAARMPANDWCDLIQQLYVGDLPEFTQIAKRLKVVLEESVPTLIKRAEPNPWTNGVDQHLALYGCLDRPAALTPSITPWSVKLVNTPEDETLALAQLLYRHSGTPLTDIVEALTNDPRFNAQSWVLFDSLFKDRRNRHDRVPKELEGLHYTFDVVMDFGAYRDLQRQRRCTILPQAMTPNLGFIVPEGGIEAGLGTQFEEALAKAGNLAQLLDKRGSKLAAYATPMAYNHRSTHIYDAAEMYYVAELRTELACHISYRRVVERMALLAKECHPNILRHVRVVPTHIEGAHS